MTYIKSLYQIEAVVIGNVLASIRKVQGSFSNFATNLKK